MRPHPSTHGVTIRLATAEDRVRVERLAIIDSARAPGGELLLAEVGHELWAAVSLQTGAVVADPFRRSGELVALLRERAQQLRGAGSTPRIPVRFAASRRQLLGRVSLLRER